MKTLLLISLFMLIAVSVTCAQQNYSDKPSDKKAFHYMHDQLYFADATGDAVIISAGKDGEMVFTRKPQGDGFLVSTNFNVANPSNGFVYPYRRYDKATELMTQLIAKEGPVTSYDARDVMDAVHVSKGSSWSIETMLADLIHGNVYIYYFFQYDRPVLLNVKYELSHPRDPGALSKHPR